MDKMFALNPKRASYRAIEEEEDQSAQQNFVGTGGADQLMSESAPQIRDHIAVSFKCEKDADTKTTKDASAQWDHIKDVDQFFALIYEYYQQKGFACITLRVFFSLFRFAFVVLFSTFLLECVDYQVLFGNRNTTRDGTPLPTKLRLHDAFLPRCHANLNPLVQIALILAAFVWLVHFARICCRLVQFYEMKHFFATQLQIPDSDLQNNMSWGQVVQALCHAQQRIHLIVNRESISSLDIYQRILRHKNYFVAFVDAQILPPKIQLPIVGPVHYLSSGLRFNLDWFLFWGPWSPWKGPYALKNEFKEQGELEQIALSMRRTLSIMALVNLCLFPFVFIYQVLFSFFSYSELFKRDPNTLGMRKYSNYGREKLRHFNEMDHELDARLNRSYEFAVRYTDQFVSPLSKIVAKNIAFVAASVFVVLAALTAYDEDTLKIEHVTLMLTISGAVVLACKVFIPSEHLVYCQHLLMRQIVANIHYAPKAWLRNADSGDVVREFAQLFQLKAELLVEELLSPLFTPFILYFYIRPKVHEIVQFYHDNSVHVDGLGDVCSLAQMDVSKDGDVRLCSLNQSMNIDVAKSRQQNPCGKVELSLLNFAAQNPDWEAPKESADFIRNIKGMVANELSAKERIGESQQQSSMDAKTLAAVIRASDLYQSMRLVKEETDRELAPLASDSALLFQSFCGQQQPEAKNSGSSAMLPKNASSAALDAERAPSPLCEEFPQNPTEAQPTAGGHSSFTSQHFTNSHLLASSFIQPSPLAAIVRPSVIQESNFRAMEMSLQALAVNQMLFLNNNVGHNEPAITTSRYPRNRFRGYDSIQMGSVRSRMGTMDSVDESTIWGVPAESQIR